MTETFRFHDRHDGSHGLWFDATDLLAHVRSAYQDIKIIATQRHGRVMLLDGVTMLTETTHHVYHEHMAHIPMACVGAPRNALVIGGGDGGVVSELVKYPALERIVLCELDGDVVELSRAHLPEIAKGLDDPRVEIRIGDGAAFLADNPGAFDLVIIDSTDICEEAHEATEIASPLATHTFHDSLQSGLRSGGVAMQMPGSPTFYRAGMKQLFHQLVPRWTSFRPVLMPCPFYISGDWCAGLMAMHDALAPLVEHAIEGACLYYNAEIARGALALPNEVATLMPPD